MRAGEVASNAVNTSAHSRRLEEESIVRWTARGAASSPRAAGRNNPRNDRDRGQGPGVLPSAKDNPATPSRHRRRSRARSAPPSWTTAGCARRVRAARAHERRRRLAHAAALRARRAALLTAMPFRAAARRARRARRAGAVVGGGRGSHRVRAHRAAPLLAAARNASESAWKLCQSRRNSRPRHSGHATACLPLTL